MKNIFLSLFFCCFSAAFSQNTIPITTNEEIGQITLQDPKPEPYDSLESLSRKNVFKHVGQTIYLKENIDCKSAGYYLLPLYSKPFFGIRREVDDMVYKPISVSNGLTYSDYNQVKNKYFFVNKIIPNTNTEILSQKENFCLELIEDQGHDTVYLQINRAGADYDAFLTMGYFEKLKKTNIGKDFIFHGNEKVIDNNLKEVDSGTIRLDIPAGTKLRCIDLSIQDTGNNHIIAIFQHRDYGELFVPYHSGGWIKLESEEDHNLKIAKKNQLVKKYGSRNARLITNRKVLIGFTKQMCIDSWGEPDKVNKSGSWSHFDHVNLTKNKNDLIEEWIYSGTYSNGYLYFENGILTKFQRQ